MCRAARYVAFGAALGSSTPASAQGTEDLAPCGPLRVETDPALLARWPDLPGQVRLAFAERDDADACAHVWLNRHERLIEVEVMLGDGRRASRVVPDARDVLPILQALLLLPEPENPASSVRLPVRASSEPEPEPPRSVKAPAPRPAAADVALDESGPPASAGKQRRDWGLEASLVGGGHIGDGQTRSTLGGLCVVDLWDWLAGFEMRGANYAPSPGGADVVPYSTLEFALLGGHRFRFEVVALDVLAGPSFTLNATESVNEGPEGTQRSSSTELLAGLRLAGHVNFAPRSLFGPFVGVEGDLGPTERSDGPAPGPGANQDSVYPGWMVGVVLGATVGTR